MGAKKILLAIALIFGMGCTSSNQTSAQPTDETECGVERWHVKNLADPDTLLVQFGNVIQSSIVSEDSIPEPSSPDVRLPLERVVIKITAILVAYKLEDDGDIHLVLQDTGGNSMIAEIPDPTCSPAKHTSHSGNYAAAIQWLKDNVGNPTTSFKDCNVSITVTGVRYFDYFHSQRGVSPNAIEIHPVLTLN
jgi:hypothetical protein